MGTGVLLTIGSFLYIVLLLIVYFTKDRINTIENKLFSKIIIVNTFGVFIHLFLFGLMNTIGTDNIFTIIVAKIYLLYLVGWISLLTIYVFAISAKDREMFLKKSKKLLNVSYFLFVLIAFIIFLLPIEFFNKPEQMYTYGMAVNAVYVISIILIILNIICLLINIKSIVQKKYIPILFYLILLIVVAFVQFKWPWIQLMTSLTSFIVYLMYFTIENPDMKMLKQVKKSKEVSDKSNLDKENFLFNVTSEINTKIGEIYTNLDNILDVDNIDEIKKQIINTKYYLTNAKKKLNETLNITEEDVKNINLINTKYNFENLIDSINMISKSKVKPGVKYIANISTSIPKYLYGDSIKLKQIILSLVDNSIKNTSNGFVELRINEITKRNLCRLIICVEDSGSGMSFERITEVLDVNDATDYDTNDISLSNIRKIVNLIGGTINIESERNKGTIVTISLNQGIVNDNYGSDYVEYINYKKILLVTDKKDKLLKVKKLFGKENIVVDVASSGEMCLKKIRNKKIYDAIVLDYNMSKLDGIQVFEKLKKINNFKTPVIIVCDSVKEKSTYYELGFYDVVDKPLTKEKMISILEKIKNVRN
ncbi:MAG: response regulator [bacterium]|nr:response regulator [bacterium]